jgi:hypothetical protein
MRTEARAGARHRAGIHCTACRRDAPGRFGAESRLGILLTRVFLDGHNISVLWFIGNLVLHNGKRGRVQFTDKGNPLD